MIDLLFYLAASLTGWQYIHPIIIPIDNWIANHDSRSTNYQLINEHAELRQSNINK